MIVEVKQKHIDDGKQGECCYCAVTLAVRDALKDKYKFSDSLALGIGDNSEVVEVGESWVETAVQGAGAEISIYTKLERKVVEDFIVIECEDENFLDTYDVEDWIQNFDTFDDSKPISFVIESINRMNN